jgi:2-aminoethylphosphonate dioxygenase
MPQEATLPDALSAEQLQQFARDGYVVVRGLFSAPEMAMLSIESERLLEMKHLQDVNNIRCRWQQHVDTDECLFDAFDPVADLSSLCDELARDPRLVDIISAIYGEPAHLLKDKLIFKRPGAKGYDLHQDFISWPSFPKSFITAAVAIDPSDKRNGCTEVFAGCHKLGCLSPRDGDYHALGVEQMDESRRVCLELEPGDVAIFGCFTPHCSGPNRTDCWRRVLYLSYNAESDGGDSRDAHYAEFRGWLKRKYAEYGKTQTFFR